MLGVMTDEHHPPHLDVKADLEALTEYRAAIDVFYRPEAQPLLIKLGDLLAHRTGWHFASDSTAEVIWTLGSFGGSVLNITITEDLKYHCYDHQADSDDEFADISEVAQWVDSREDAALEHLKRWQRGFASGGDWYALKVYEYRLDVDWFDGHFAAAVFGIPMEATFARTLPDVIRAGRELIINWHDAPSKLGDSLKVNARLSERAVAQVIANTA